MAFIDLEHYTTEDVNEASVLACKGFKYTIDRSTMPKMKFVFSGDVRIMRSLVREYWDADIEVMARKLQSATKELKKAMYSDGNYVHGYHVNGDKKNV